MGNQKDENENSNDLVRVGKYKSWSFLKTDIFILAEDKEAWSLQEFMYSLFFFFASIFDGVIFHTQSVFI